MVKYTHLELNRDIKAPAGYYTPQKEARLPYHGREVLYIVSHAVIDAACCGTADFNSALVPGYIIRWQAGTNKDGLPVSEVEPIADQAIRDDISHIILETENVKQTEFW
jgi:hypothetical protein